MYLRSFLITLISCYLLALQPAQPRFHVLALAENGGHHVAYSKVAKGWFGKLAAGNNFAIDYVDNIGMIDSVFLSKYNLFIRLDYPPYGWKPAAVKALEQYVNEGRGGWIGFHHATLPGEFYTSQHIVTSGLQQHSG
jgi:hypothetical protein